MKHASPSLHNGEGATNPANQLIDLGRQKEGYQGNWRQKIVPSHLGIEPRTFGLEVQRAILCANGTHVTYTYFISHDTYGPLAQLVRASC